MEFEQEINQLKDTLVVMAEIQRRQAEVQRVQAERIIATEEGMKLHEQRMTMSNRTFLRYRTSPTG
jgi:hypothetical protein